MISIEWEADAVFIHRTRDRGGQTIATMINPYDRAYVLCGSVRFDADLMLGFDSDSYVRRSTEQT